VGTLLCITTLANQAFGVEVPAQQFGGYMQHSLSATGTPNTATISTGSYHFQAGWLEPLYDCDEVTQGIPYLSSTVQLDASIFYSHYSALFNIGILKWLKTGIGYTKVLYHKSLLDYDGLAPRSEWSPQSVLSDLRDNRGAVSGADVFSYTLSFSIPTSLVRFHSSIRREQWNIETHAPYVYDYKNGILVQNQEKYTYVIGELRLFPDQTFSPTLRNTYMHTDISAYHTNLLQFGFPSIGLYKGLYMSAYAGNWTQHPQVEAWSWEGIDFQLELTWAVQFLR
jgi:hypothetical protein